MYVRCVRRANSDVEWPRVRPAIQFPPLWCCRWASEPGHSIARASWRLLSNPDWNHARTFLMSMAGAEKTIAMLSSVGRQHAMPAVQRSICQHSTHPPLDFNWTWSVKMSCMNRILIIGATGTVGRQVLSQLPATDVEVRALVRNPRTAGLPSHVDVVTGDLTLPETRSEERRVGKECRSRWSPYH